MHCKTMFLFSVWYYSCIKYPFKFQKKSFGKNIKTKHERLEMKIYNFDINREAAKISASSSSKIDKYEYLTGKEILPPDQRRKIGPAKLIYYFFGKALKSKQKQLKIKEENR